MTTNPMKTFRVGGYGLRVTEIVDFVVMVHAHSESEARAVAVGEACEQHKFHPSMIEIETVTELDTPAEVGA